MMNWLRNFFYGRYGNDALNIALLLLAMVLALVFRFTPWWWLSYICYLPLILLLFRAFSRNIDKRRHENDVFLSGFRKIKGWWTRQRDKAKDKTHKYYKCPCCGAQLRVPKGRGKICITCPKCKKEFVKKT
ncbi:MAG: hypothetical protein PUC32_02305 [Oscillospiraceae bacterium]|nr:hypothetical protein [Oscillospiraceae bacterium]